MAPNTGVLDDKVAGWLKRIDKMGFRSIVVSNNPRAMYTREAEKVVNMPVIGNAGKPRRKQLYRAVEILGMDPHEVAIVGDRPLTDIWGGHRLGSKTILVESLSKHKENALIRFLRKLEWLAIHPSCTFAPKPSESSRS
jgi:HAD superfamily phosphatase (TIGR01668 family)